MLPSRLEVEVEGNEHFGSMVLRFAHVRLFCFPSAPPVHVNRKSGGVVMLISMREWGWRSWYAEQWRKDVASCRRQKNLEGLL